jgi:hypothetical protein
MYVTGSDNDSLTDLSLMIVRDGADSSSLRLSLWRYGYLQDTACSRGECEAASGTGEPLNLLRVLKSS